MAKVVVDADGVTHRAVEHSETLPLGERVFFTALCRDFDVLDAFRPMTLGDYQNGPKYEPQWLTANVRIGVPTCVRCAGAG